MTEACDTGDLVTDRLLCYRPFERHTKTSEQNKPAHPTAGNVLL
jgi:hypothetical protein